MTLGTYRRRRGACAVPPAWRRAWCAVPICCSLRRRRVFAGDAAYAGCRRICSGGKDPPGLRGIRTSRSRRRHGQFRRLPKGKKRNLSTPGMREPTGRFTRQGNPAATGWSAQRTACRWSRPCILSGCLPGKAVTRRSTNSTGSWSILPTASWPLRFSPNRSRPMPWRRWSACWKTWRGISLMRKSFCLRPAIRARRITPPCMPGLLEKTRRLTESPSGQRSQSTDCFSYVVNDVVIGHMLSEDRRFFPYVRP